MITGEEAWKTLKSNQKDRYVLRTGIKRIVTKAIVCRNEVIGREWGLQDINKKRTKGQARTGLRDPNSRCG